MNSRKVLVLPLLGVVLISLSAFAADPPGRVARLDYITGQVSIQPNGVDQWVAASVNRPLTTSDRVWTDKESRAELQMGAASARLNGETSLTLANVSDRAVQLQLDQGTLNLHVFRLFEGEVYEIDTPNLAFTVAKPGDYRFDVDNAGDTTRVTVWKGRGVATGDNPGVKIGAHQQMTFQHGRSLNYFATNAPGLDGFDSWCQARAALEDKSPSLQYVSPYAVGYSDLDQYGYWQTIAPYGPVWVPSGVAVGWAPYRWGHWVYIAPWGWTWVDDAPWGFAPFHYGRWVYFGSYWGWCPGPIYARPIWAPALVGWIGGPHFGFGLSFGIGGGVGWFPLGWGEPYVPWYGASRGYFQNVNVTNTHITNITNVTNNYYGNRHPVNPIHFVNQRPDGVTAVSNGVFTGSRPTREGLVPVTTQALNGAKVVNTVPERPTRESVMGPSQHTAPPPASVFSRPVVTKMTPPAPPTVSAGIGRPDRGAVGTQPGTTAPVAGETNRPMRGYPAPGNAPTVADDESPRGIPHPPSVEANRGGTPAPSTTNAMPSRVPHPPESLGRPMGEPTSTPTAQPSAPTMPARVPRPSEGLTSTQPSSQSAVPERRGGEQPGNMLRTYPHPTETPSPASRASSPQTPVPQSNVVRDERPSRGIAPEQPVPRPNVTPAPTPNVTREDRPTSRPIETRPPTAPAPAPKASPPAQQNHTDKKDSGPKAGLSYPSPHNPSYAPIMRPASFAGTYPHPTGPVAPAPRTYSASYSASHSYSLPQSYGTRAQSGYSAAHYSPAPRYSSGVSAAHVSHAAAGAARSAPSSASHGRH